MSRLTTGWQTPLPNTGVEVTSTLVYQDNIYAASNGYVYKLDYRSGQVIASHDLEGYAGKHEIRLAITDDGNTLVVGTNGYIIGLKAFAIDQTPLWKQSLRESGYEIVNLLTVGNIGYAGSNGYVYAFDITTGSELHRNDLSGMGYNEVRLSITLNKDVLLVGTNGYAWGLDPTNLDKKWTANLPESGHKVTSVLGGHGCCYAGAGGHLYKIDAATGEGADKNHNSLPNTGTQEVRLALRTGSDGGCVFVGTNGYAVAVKPSSIETIWCTSLKGSGYSVTDVVAGETSAYFANSGYVFLLDEKGSEISRNSLPGLGEHETRLALASTPEQHLLVGIAGYVAELISVDPPSSGPWMSAMAKIIGPKKLREVAIPGTHDSGSYAISALSQLGNDDDIPEPLRSVLSIPVLPLAIFKAYLASWHVNLKANFLQQLNAGIRYFDLRVQGNPLCFVHGFRSAPVTDLMTQLSKFFSTPGNDKEVVILDFQHLHILPAETHWHKELVDLLSDTFGEKLAPFNTIESSLSVTLDQLWATPHRIIVLYNEADEPSVKGTPFLWPRKSSIVSEWPNKQNVAELKTVLDTELKKERTGFLVLQGVLTPTIGMIAVNDVNLAADQAPAENLTPIDPNAVVQQLKNNPVNAKAAAVRIAEEYCRVFSKDPSSELALHLEEMKRFIQEARSPLSNVVKEDIQQEDSQ